MGLLHYALKFPFGDKSIQKSKDHFPILRLQFINLKDTVECRPVYFFFRTAHQIIKAYLEGIRHTLGNVNGRHSIVSFIASDNLTGYFNTLGKFTLRPPFFLAVAVRNLVYKVLGCAESPKARFSVVSYS